MSNSKSETSKNRIEVVDWTKFGDKRYYDMFNFEIPFETAFNAVVDAMKKNGYKFSGYYHQYGEHGVPVLTGGIRFEVSTRVWGRVMAEVLNDHELGEMSYTKWAYEPNEKEVVP